MIRKRYFDWLYYSVVDRKTSYRELCEALDGRIFEYYIPLDSNRYEDGVDLRYHFAREKGIPDAQIAAELDVRPCSIFEMMVALARRMEQDVTYDPELGNQASEYFTYMLESLGLASMTDSVGVDERYFDIAIDRFISRSYEPNGKGGLFRIDDCEHDLRDVEIWYQAMWYLSHKEDCEI